MATTAWRLLTLLTLLTELPLGLQFEIGGVDVGAGRLLTKVSSELMKGLQLPKQTSTAPQDPQHMETGDDDDLEDSDAPMDEQEAAMWHNLLDEIVKETDQLDDTIFEEEEETIGTRAEVPEAVDCYGLPTPISKALRFLFRTDRKETVNTRYFLSTRKHRDTVEIKQDPEFNFNSTDFDPRRSKTVFIVHGFMSNGEMQWVRNLSDAMLNMVDANVIAVDWSGGGGSWMYWRAVANTRVTGAEVTKLIEKMMKMGLKNKSIHLIGHSLGAHICSYIAAHLGGVARITGLDPAQPCFQTDSPDIRLDPSDADFIDVIHTNGRVLLKVGLGLPQPIGHVDFYPNGGAKQPGCSKKRNKLLFPVLGFIKSRIEKSICSHGRSYMFFIESLKMSDKCSFWGHRWDRNESDANTAVAAPCTAANCTEMGIETDIFPARGSFYVPTQAKTPYCSKYAKLQDILEKTVPYIILF
ncbi:hypothetical protein B7P43_G02266 [Cryptotermes secundus]|uniref:Lipase domain-containing protein n=1 Tax=Cryptotermes secundus TaxID=105785 RepID=A0A2J7QG74_9NEOP|nr:hypothetical protein B7P43_G02266 [Cryptotermes secundus]